MGKRGKKSAEEEEEEGWRAERDYHWFPVFFLSYNKSGRETWGGLFLDRQVAEVEEKYFV